jgi:L-fucose isomerase-like protein
MEVKQVTVGLIVGNRGFFPNHLCEAGRRDMIAVLEKRGFRVIALDTGDTPYGTVESVEDARKCAALFDAHRAGIDGVVVTLPNFGDERAIANTMRWSGLKVPLLVQATPDVAGTMTIKDRRDSFCGKMSACNNLRQYGIPFTLTRLHTSAPGSESFAADLTDFEATCRITSGLRNLRIGALGARPAAFNTVRYSEKLLERHGISVETLDLYELFGWVGKMKDDDPAAKAKLEELRSYVKTDKVPAQHLLKMAKFGATVEKWMADKQLQASAIQCWTAMEEFFGVVPCACMSLMSNKLIPSACEVDIMGTVAMYILALAGGRPSAIVDWNNNYGDDPDKGVIFHCSNLPKDVFQCDAGRQPEMDFQEIIAGSVGKENSYGTVVGRMRKSPLTYLRASTDDEHGVITAYMGEGDLTDDPLETFGGYGVVRIPRLQELLRHICLNGFEHHVAVNLSTTGAAVREALGRYLGWQVHYHG